MCEIIGAIIREQNKLDRTPIEDGVTRHEIEVEIERLREEYREMMEGF